MATLKQRLHRKNASGTYDTIHFESTSDLILRPSGRTVEQDLADYLPEVQASDSVPQSLGWVRGNTKAFINKKSISFDGHTHSASQITSGTLPISHGGTGVTSLEDIIDLLGITSTKFQQIGYKRCITSGSNINHPEYNEYNNPSLVQIPITGSLTDYAEIIFYSHILSHERYGSVSLYPAIYFTSQTVTSDDNLQNTEYFAHMNLDAGYTDGTDTAWCKLTKLTNNIWINITNDADYTNLQTNSKVIDISLYQNVVYAYPYDTHYATIDNYIFAR